SAGSSSICLKHGTYTVHGPWTCVFSFLDPFLFGLLIRSWLLLHPCSLDTGITSRHLTSRYINPPSFLHPLRRAELLAPPRFLLLAPRPLFHLSDASTIPSPTQDSREDDKNNRHVGAAQDADGHESPCPQLPKVHTHTPTPPGPPQLTLDR